MIIYLPDDLESKLRTAVLHGDFPSGGDMVATILREYLQRQQQQAMQPVAPGSPPSDTHAPSARRKPIWEVAEELRKSIPAEEWDKLPVDGAAQHDHYIYGTPKRPAS
jgi:hypothetical protein